MSWNSRYSDIPKLCWMYVKWQPVLKQHWTYSHWGSLPNRGNTVLCFFFFFWHRCGKIVGSLKNFKSHGNVRKLLRRWYTPCDSAKKVCICLNLKNFPEIWKWRFTLITELINHINTLDGSMRRRAVEDHGIPDLWWRWSTKGFKCPCHILKLVLLQLVFIITTTVSEQMHAHVLCMRNFKPLCALRVQTKWNSNFILRKGQLTGLITCS